MAGRSGDGAAPGGEPSPWPSLGRTVVRSWRGAAAAAAGLPLLVAGTAVMFGVVDGVLGDAPSRGLAEPHPGGVRVEVLGVATAVLHALAGTPLSVSFFRRRLSGESGWVSGDAGTMLRFAVWWSVLALLASGFGIGTRLGGAWLGTAAAITALVLQTRWVLAAPAIALGGGADAPGWSWRATRGRFWWLFAGGLMVGAPVWLPSLAVAAWRFRRSGAVAGSVVLDAGLEVLAVAGLLLDAGFAAQLFADRGEDRGGRVGNADRAPDAAA